MWWRWKKYLGSVLHVFRHVFGQLWTNISCTVKSRWPDGHLLICHYALSQPSGHCDLFIYSVSGATIFATYLFHFTIYFFSLLFFLSCYILQIYKFSGHSIYKQEYVLLLRCKNVDRIYFTNVSVEFFF